MNKIVGRTLALALLMPLKCWATVDISPIWESVAFTAGVVRVEAKATPPSYRLTKLRIWVSGKRASIARSEFENITNPVLDKITVTYVTRLRSSNYKGPHEAYVQIPFLVKEPMSSGPFKEGGTWFFFFEDSKFTHSQFEPPQGE